MCVTTVNLNRKLYRFDMKRYPYRSCSIVIAGILLVQCQTAHCQRPAAQPIDRTQRDAAVPGPVIPAPASPFQLPAPKDEQPSVESVEPPKRIDLDSAPQPRSEIARVEAAWNVNPISSRALAPNRHDNLSFSGDKRDQVWLSNDTGNAIKPTQWMASGLHANPTYFEDVDAENYGITHFLQPARSGLKFYSDVLLLPWEMKNHCPSECIYSLGHERPGNCVISVKENRDY